MKTKNCSCKKHKATDCDGLLTPEYIVNLFEITRTSNAVEWEHNKKRLTEIITRFGEEKKNELSIEERIENLEARTKALKKQIFSITSIINNKQK